MRSSLSLLLPLDHIDQLFTASDANPFSTHVVDILGESGLEYVKKRLISYLPGRPDSLHVTIQLPSEQITPDLVERTNTAVQRYCANRIASNRLQRGLVIQRSLRQMTGAILGILAALLVIGLLSINPLGLIPDVLRGILVVLASFAIAVLIFDGLWSVVFDWVPFVQDNTVHTMLMDMDLAIEPKGQEGAG